MPEEQLREWLEALVERWRKRRPLGFSRVSEAFASCADDLQRVLDVMRQPDGKRARAERYAAFRLNAFAAAIDAETYGGGEPLTYTEHANQALVELEASGVKQVGSCPICGNESYFSGAVWGGRGLEGDAIKAGEATCKQNHSLWLIISTHNPPCCEDWPQRINEKSVWTKKDLEELEKESRKLSDFFNYEDGNS